MSDGKDDSNENQSNFIGVDIPWNDTDVDMGTSVSPPAAGVSASGTHKMFDDDDEILPDIRDIPNVRVSKEQRRKDPRESVDFTKFDDSDSSHSGMSTYEGHSRLDQMINDANRRATIRNDTSSLNFRNVKNFVDVNHLKDLKELKDLKNITQVT